MDLWECFVGRTDMFVRDGLYLSGKGAAVFVGELSAAIDSGIGAWIASTIFSVANIV